MAGRLVRLLPQLPAHAYSYLGEYVYWANPSRKQALAAALRAEADVYHANDWSALPVAVRAAQSRSARVVFDAHEYAPLEWEHNLLWLRLKAPVIVEILRKYSPFVDASMTVAPALAQRYSDEFNLDPVVVLNTPRAVSGRTAAVDPTSIRLIHHGNAVSSRRLERMIEAIALSDERFSLHFMLTDGTRGYKEFLSELASRAAPGRVTFRDPVRPERIVKTIREYDMGFCLLEPNSYNSLVSLPNKFFDFIAAGLGICVGPSPSMAEMVEHHRIGCVSSSFAPTDVSATLNSLTASQIDEMRCASRETAKKINAHCEMAKVVGLYHRLLDESTT